MRSALRDSCHESRDSPGTVFRPLATAGTIREARFDRNVPDWRTSSIEELPGPLNIRHFFVSNNHFPYHLQRSGEYSSGQAYNYNVFDDRFRMGFGIPQARCVRSVTVYATPCALPGVLSVDMLQRQTLYEKT